MMDVHPFLPILVYRDEREVTQLQNLIVEGEKWKNEEMKRFDRQCEKSMEK